MGLLTRNRLLWLLLIFSTALKFFYVFALTDYHNYLFSDFAGYWDRALQRLSGNAVNINQWVIWPPFGHIVLAQIFKIIFFLGLDAYRLQIILSLNILLSSASVYWLYHICLKLYDNNKFAITAATFYAFCFPLLYFNAFVMSEHPAIAAVIFALYVLLSFDGFFAVFAGGIILAFAVAIRPAFGLLGGLFFLYILFGNRLSWDSLKRSILFCVGFFGLIFLVFVENSSISHGKLKGLAASGGLNFYFAQCKTFKVTSIADGYLYVIVPPSTVEHPENGSVTVYKPFYDQEYFFALGKECIKANPQIWLENFVKFKTLFFGPVLPSAGSAWGFPTVFTAFRHLLFGMTIFALLFPFVFRHSGVNRPLALLLASIPIVSLVTLYFFNAEHRYFYSFLFALCTLSILTAYIFITNIKQYKKHLVLFISLLFSVYASYWLYNKFVMGSIQKRINLTVTQNSAPITFLDQPRQPMRTELLAVDRIDFLDSGIFKHYLMGETGWKNSFFIDMNSSFIVKRDGQYEFFVYSDDGNRLNIDGKTICEFTTGRAMEESSGKVWLQKGLHTAELTYFQGFGSCGLKVLYRPQNAKRYFFGEDSEFIEFKN